MEFYKQIGSPRFVVAPMVDQSELCYRMQTRKYGAQLVYTQMFNANSFVQSKEYRECNFTTCPEDRPLVVQFGGHDPEILLEAAKFVEDKCDAVDLNIGCPQGIAKRGHYGAYLMEDLELLGNIVSTLSKNLKCKVTCKSRIYKSFERTIRLYETLVDAGASIITIHGRTRDEKGHNTALADWEMIRRVKEHFVSKGVNIPIFANGGIEFYEDIQKCLNVTKVEGVMVSEAILENPSFFMNNIYHGRVVTQLDLAEEYLAMCNEYPVWQFKSIRSHFMKLCHRYFWVHTDIRDKSGSKTGSYGGLVDLHEVCRDLRRLIVNDTDYTGSWYRRYRKLDVYAVDHSLSGRLDVVRSVQQTMIDRRPKLWDSVEEGDGGMFSNLGMFDEKGEEGGLNIGDDDVAGDGELCCGEYDASDDY